jgi:hypothetical protein
MRLATAIGLGLATGIVVFTGVAGATASVAAGLAAAVLAAAAAGGLACRFPVVAVDEAAAPRFLRAVALVAAALALLQFGRLAVFLADSSRTGFSAVPFSRWEIRHSCLTAYYIAGKAVGEVPNVYDDRLYSLPGDKAAKRTPRDLGGFNVDVYEYPPPFLLLPRLLFHVAPDFPRFRLVWFAVNAGVVLAVMLAAVRRLGPAVGTRALLLVPLVWASPPVVSAFQKENVQMLVVALSVLAMLLFDRGRPAAGGFVLAFAIASKLYPGMLVALLLFQRRWRAIAWTAAFGAAIVLVSLLDTGWGPYAAFLGHLPALLSGEAFPAFRNPMAAAINLSVPGLAFKMKLFGAAGGYGVAKVLGWISTVAALVLIARVARRPGGDRGPRTWLAIVLAATLCSPFLPQAYGCFPPLWLLTLLAAERAPEGRTLALTAAAWLVLSTIFPMDVFHDARLVALLVLPVQALSIALAVAGAEAQNSSSSAIRT